METSTIITIVAIIIATISVIAAIYSKNTALENETESKNLRREVAHHQQLFKEAEERAGRLDIRARDLRARLDNACQFRKTGRRTFLPKGVDA